MRRSYQVPCGSLELMWVAVVILHLVTGIAMGQPAALTNRVANTTIKMPPYPPTFGYMLSNAFGGLLFSNPVSLVSAPAETNRLFVVERGGRVIAITNLANPNRTLFLDISRSIAANFLQTEEEGLAAIAFHPGYATNGYFYALYEFQTNNPTGDEERYQRLARFQRSANDPNLALAESELPLITQLDRNVVHSYNDLKFGPDGYLYIAVGDEGDYNDPNDNSQRIDKNFFSGILRIDVDSKAGSLPPNPHPSINGNYRVPPDNPFVGATWFNGVALDPARVRTEFWAVGLRNPYRLAFEPQTGVLFCGDVGEARREEINVIVKGGNYGWAYLEGTMEGQKTNLPPAGPDFSPIPPLIEYDHGNQTNQGRAVIGGMFYRGQRLSQLSGSYLYGDHVFGNIWATHYDGTNAGSPLWLAREPGLTCFAPDPRNGEVLVVNHITGRIRQLTYSSASVGPSIPATLADTGVFSTTAKLLAQPGVVAYDVNLPFWSDGAIKRRWFSIPNVAQKIEFNPTNNWQFPTGTVWIKHFDLQLTNGSPASTKRIETRLLVKNSDGVYGVTYRWGASLTNATLLAEGGLNENFRINDGGVIRTQTWHYPSRSECLLCHTKVAGHALGFNTAQLNRDFSYGSLVDNQIAVLSRAGYFTANVTNVNLLWALAAPTNNACSLGYRARCYLAANCAQCHQPGGVTGALWDARLCTPLADADLIEGEAHDNLGDTNNRVVHRGSLKNSILYSRLSNLGNLHMPPLGSTRIDAEGTNLIAQWITQDLTHYTTYREWQLHFFGTTNSLNGQINADPDHDGAANYMEFLTGTDPINPADVWKLNISITNRNVRLSFRVPPECGIELQSSENVATKGSWVPLDFTANRPFFSSVASNATYSLADGTNQFFRARLFTY